MTVALINSCDLCSPLDKASYHTLQVSDTSMYCVNKEALQQDKCINEATKSSRNTRNYNHPTAIIDFAVEKKSGKSRIFFSCLTAHYIATFFDNKSKNWG